MSDRLPTIPEIVRALNALDDEWAQAVREVKAAHDRQQQELLKGFDRTKEQYEAQMKRNETTINGLSAVIDTLEGMLETIRSAAGRDQRDAAFMEPGDVFRMTQVDIGALRASEIRKAKERLAQSSRQTATPLSEPSGISCVRCDKDEAAHLGWAQGHLHQIALSTNVQAAPEDGTGSPEDICICGCARKAHEDATKLGGAQCVQCPSDDERSWRHEFALAVL
jgi:hypothetical protein